MCFFLFLLVFFFFCKQKTAYDMRISDWSSDVCSSDLSLAVVLHPNTSTVEVRLADLALEDGVGVALDERRCRGLAGFLGREGDRKSVVEGKSVSVRVDLGGRRIINKKKERSRSSELKGMHTKTNRQRGVAQARA